MIAVVEGRIDGTTAPELHEAVEATITTDDTGMVLDFAGVDYVSSAGLRAVLQLAQRLQKQNGEMIVCSLNDMIRGVFEISGFDKIISIQASRGDALAAIGD